MNTGINWTYSEFVKLLFLNHLYSLVQKLKRETKIEVMDWFILLLVYFLLVSIVTIEGYRRAIGGTAAFLISLLLTPVVGFFAVWFSKKRIVFRHFVKLNNNKIKEDAIKKTLHRSGKDHWVEIKSSDLRII